MIRVSAGILLGGGEGSALHGLITKVLRTFKSVLLTQFLWLCTYKQLHSVSPYGDSRFRIVLNFSNLQHPHIYILPRLGAKWLNESSDNCHVPDTLGSATTIFAPMYYLFPFSSTIRPYHPQHLFYAQAHFTLDTSWRNLPTCPDALPILFCFYRMFPNLLLEFALLYYSCPFLYLFMFLSFSFLSFYVLHSFSS
jgi:hypothetical protein